MSTSKGTICTHFVTGGCSRGATCPFSHVLEQVAPEGVDASAGYYVGSEVANYDLISIGNASSRMARAETQEACSIHSDVTAGLSDTTTPADASVSQVELPAAHFAAALDHTAGTPFPLTSVLTPQGRLALPTSCVFSQPQPQLQLPPQQLHQSDVRYALCAVRDPSSNAMYTTTVPQTACAPMFVQAPQPMMYTAPACFAGPGRVNTMQHPSGGGGGVAQLVVVNGVVYQALPTWS